MQIINFKKIKKQFEMEKANNKFVDILRRMYVCMYVCMYVLLCGLTCPNKTLHFFPLILI
jgi:hypothetical protein